MHPKGLTLRLLYKMVQGKLEMLGLMHGSGGSSAVEPYDPSFFAKL